MKGDDFMYGTKWSASADAGAGMLPVANWYSVGCNL